MASAVTLIIPTVERRAILFARTLRYLSEIRYEGEIIVSDHSLSRDADSIADIAGQHGDLRLRLLKHPPEAHFLERLVLCAVQTQSDYVHLHADDDFIIKPTLDRLLKDMEASPRLVAAMGMNINLSLEDRQFHAIRKSAVTYEGPFQRLIAQLENYSSVLYALRRRDEFIETLSYTQPRCPDVQFWQYLESCVAAIKGTILVTDDLHYVRSIHDNKWSTTLLRAKSRDHFPYLIFSDQFHPRLIAFRAALVAACAENDSDVVVDDVMLDAAIIHLVFRGLSIMGLPQRQTPKIKISHEEILAAKLRDPSNPVGAELIRICELARQYPLPKD